MKTARPAPLLPVALFFTAGCLLGLHGPLNEFHWLAAALAFGVVWVVARCWAASSWASLAALLFFTLATGAYHGTLRKTCIDPSSLRLFSAAALSGQSQWRGIVCEDPRYRPRRDKDNLGNSTLVIAVREARLPRLARVGDGEPFQLDDWRQTSGRLQVRVQNSTPDQFHYGDIVEVNGGLRTPDGPRNPGQFDIAAYLARNDIYYEISVPAEKVKKIGDNGGPFASQWAFRARDWAVGRLRLGIEDDTATSSLLAGMLIGYVAEVPGEIETAFRNTGTYHIFAVSGQNVAEILGVGLVALQLCGLVRWRWGWLMVPVLVFYCLVTGGQPSAVRALLMAVLVLLAWWWERPASTINLWSLALLAVMIYDPKLVGNLSFQLSFAVVGTLILLTPPIYNFLSWPFTPKETAETDEEKNPSRAEQPYWQHALAQTGKATLLLFSSSLAASVGSFPLMFWYFHQVTWVSLIANIIVVPLAGFIVVIGTLSLVVALVAAPLTAAINNTNWLLAKILVACVTAFSQIPGSNVYVPPPPVAWQPAEPEFVCAQTGSTTTLLIRHHDKRWLVNTGTESQFRFVTNPLRKYYGVNGIDAAILTELSSPQAGGASSLLDEHIVRRWITPPPIRPSRVLVPWQQKMAAQSVATENWSAGQEIALSPELNVTVLWPRPENSASRMEDRGMALLFRYQNQSLLYAGRIGPDSEKRILESGADVRAAVLVQGAHGVKPNLPLEWLEAVRPQHLILPAPAAYDTGPHFDSVDLLPAGERPQIWRQENCGAVTIRFHADTVEVESFLSERPEEHFVPE
jgi:competence protein ComEC